MAQACDHARFTFKAHPRIRVMVDMVAHDLYSNISVKRCVFAKVNFGHAPARDQFADLHIPNRLSIPVGHCRIIPDSIMGQISGDFNDNLA